jgi:hypothetical protein
MKKHYEKKGMFYIGCKLNTEDDERLKKEKMMKLGRMKTVVPVRGLLESDEEPEPEEGITAIKPKSKRSVNVSASKNPT